MRYVGAVLLHGNAGTASVDFKSIRSVVVNDSPPAAPKAVSARRAGTADVYMESGQVMGNAEVSCGPRGTRGYVKSVQYTRDRNTIEKAQYGPSSDLFLDFGKLTRIDFTTMSADDRRLIDANRSYRDWILKGDVTFVDGTVWKDVYLLDICFGETVTEKHQLKDVSPTAIVFHNQ